VNDNHQQQHEEKKGKVVVPQRAKEKRKRENEVRRVPQKRNTTLNQSSKVLVATVEQKLRPVETALKRGFCWEGNGPTPAGKKPSLRFHAVEKSEKAGQRHDTRSRRPDERNAKKNFSQKKKVREKEVYSGKSGDPLTARFPQSNSPATTTREQRFVVQGGRSHGGEQKDVKNPQRRTEL